MSDCYDLDRITSIIKVEGYLVNETPLRVGSGKTQTFTSITDNPLLTINGKPIIPGSSLKGALRSLAEAYVKSWTEDKYNKVCDIDDEECESCKNGKYCIPCTIFGFKDLSGRVYILDAIAEEYTISQRTMVAIDRVFGGQLPGHLYSLDFVEPGGKFKFTMFIYNLDFINGEVTEWKAKAVEVMRFLINSMIQGIFIGARKTTGFGLIKLTQPKFYLSKGDLLKLQEVKPSWLITPS